MRAARFATILLIAALQGLVAVGQLSPPPPPPPPEPVYCLDFDGINDYLLLPTVENVYGVAMWVKISSIQPQTTYYIIDARYGTPEGYFGNGVHGNIWQYLYADGYQVPVAWDSLAAHVDSWVHLHFEASETFSDNINVMSRVVGGDATNPLGCLKGRLASVYLWGRVVPAEEVAQIARGGDGEDKYEYDHQTQLLVYFSLEEGEGSDTYDITEQAEQPGQLVNGPTWVLENPVWPGWHPPYTTETLYLLDARYGDIEGYFSNRCSPSLPPIFPQMLHSRPSLPCTLASIGGSPDHTQLRAPYK
ncbi:hypothetical protein CYMTET_12758 [Cymbomonas tetramitiformis]|uniref:Uncharacterized protein n=1 Tax=Cymbomonas tetramitiformis TaxID=36881 RepID=A0AAE0GJT9_9CHLO|nr:hypothetical protein CYMTET_12758 [Cymbomonas tetramitiformis]